jgi:hypothetical protein
MASLHGGSALSSVIRPRLRVAARRIAALSCSGVLASTGVAFAAPSPKSGNNGGAHLGDMSGYVVDAGSYFYGMADQVSYQHPEPYRSG